MKILFAEDETDLRDAVSIYLSMQGHHVVAVDNGHQAVEKTRQDAFDVILLDVMMPIMDGFAAIKEIRKDGNVVPTIFLTAKSRLADKIEGLDLGADDYLTKPFAMEELNARLRALHRRQRDYKVKRISIGNVELDIEQSQLRAVNTISISYRETSLFEFLIGRAGDSVREQELAQEVWPNENAGSDVIWLYVSFLREKLKSIQANVIIDGERGGPFVMMEI